jgi:serine/threonine protein kinase
VRGRAGQFEGYSIIGSLPTGGSGAKLYIAEPDTTRRQMLARDGFAEVDRVVIKAFSLTEGSSLPQIVRESRSLDAAKRLGLILDHEMGQERFHYVMRYVPGDSLSMATRRLHAESAPGGLDPRALRAALAYVSDLVDTLSLYHKGGLWHKDVKPDNIIIDHRDGRAHLVDFGLVSSLRSAMTLTTHGTEYFRDPEMVRLALRGVKVHEVDGTRFDIYGVGAVLYSVIEDSFPAHGELSQVTKRCPEAVKWIIRRAMASYDKRYDSAALMLADLNAVLAAPDPFALRPIELPSMAGRGIGEAPADASSDPASVRAKGSPLAGGLGAAAAAWAGAVGAAASRAMGAPGAVTPTAPTIRVTNWWSGEAIRDDRPAARAASPIPAAAPVVAPMGPSRWVDPRATSLHRGRTAPELRAAAAARRAAYQQGRRGGGTPAGLNWGLGVAVLVVLGTLGTFIARSFTPPSASFESGMEEFAVDLPSDPAFPGDIVVDLGPIETETSDAIARALASSEATIEAARSSAEQAADAAKAQAEALRARLEVESGSPVGLPPREFEGTRVLVVSDVLAPRLPEVEAAIAKAEARLRSRGFVLVGNVVTPAGNSETPESVESRISTENELLAGVRMRLGQTPTDSPQARAILAAWIESSRAAGAQGPELVVWISPPATKEQVIPRFSVFGPEVRPGSDEARRVLRMLKRARAATVDGE